MTYFQNSTKLFIIVIETSSFLYNTQQYNDKGVGVFKKSIQFIYEFFAIFLRSAVFQTSVFDLKTPQNSEKWKIENSIWKNIYRAAGEKIKILTFSFSYWFLIPDFLFGQG